MVWNFANDPTNQLSNQQTNNVTIYEKQLSVCRLARNEPQWMLDRRLAAWDVYLAAYADNKRDEPWRQAQFASLCRIILALH